MHWICLCLVEQHSIFIKPCNLANQMTNDFGELFEECINFEPVDVWGG